MVRRLKGLTQISALRERILDGINRIYGILCSMVLLGGNVVSFICFVPHQINKTTCSQACGALLNVDKAIVRHTGILTLNSPERRALL